MNTTHFTELSAHEQRRALFTMTGSEIRTVKDLPGLNQRVRHQAELLLEVRDKEAARAATRLVKRERIGRL